MNKKFIFLILSFIFLSTPLFVGASVVINEIAWMGTENSSSDEWIELKNTSSISIDLNNYTLEAEDGSPIINLEGNIIANEYFLLERTDDDSVPIITADQIYTGALGNSGEYLKLKDNENNVIDEINAPDEWPAGDNSTKQTMQLINNEWKTGNATPKAENSAMEQESPTTENEKIIPISNYTPIPDAGNDIIGFVGQEIEFNGLNSSDPNGYELAYSWNMGNGELIEKDKFTYIFNYPGTYLVTLMVYNGRNYAWDTITVKIQTQEICINEFLPNSEEKDEQGEWIEIYNNSDSIIDISDWQLDYEEEGSNPFVFPRHTLIAPKTYLVFDRKITKIALNNDKDSVRLLLPQGIVFQEITYENPKQGQSSARTEEGFVWAVPTPGMINILEAVGGIDREITYQYEVEKQETKESEYVVEYNNPEQNIENGYIAQEPSFSNPLTREIDNQLAMVPTSNKIIQAINNKDLSNNPAKQNTFNLILIIIAVILSALIFGIFVTRFTKKST